VLAERDPVLAELSGISRRVGRGAGRLVLLRGEAGVGKTTVIAAFVGGLDSPTRVLRGWCDPLAVPRPLGPLIDVLAGFGDAAATGLAEAVDAGDTATLYQRLLAELGAGGRWVWVIEDAHWADSATLDLVRFVARRIDSLPLLLLLSYRDDELGAQHPLTVALGDVATSAVNRIKVEPLSRQAVAVLATGSGINADQLHQLTGGNPFFVTEILASGLAAPSSDALPRSVSEAVAGRLARLSSPGRETAHAVAVCGPRADVSLVHAICPVAAAALSECVAAGVLIAEGGVVAFRHELARRATLAQIPDFDRIALHRHALASLAEPPVDADTLAALAFHADEGGDADAAVRYGIAAAERAASLGANREAAGLFRLALRHAGAVPGERKVIWHEQHAFSSYLCGQVEAAVTSWREAIALRHELGDRMGEGEGWRWLSLMLLALEGTSAAAEAGRAALRLLETLGPSPQLAWSLVNLAQISALSYDPGMTEYVDRAITLGTQLGDDAVVLQARSYAGLATVFRTDTGWDAVEAAWQEAMNNPAVPEHAAFIGMIICWTAATHHDLDRAERCIAQTGAWCLEHDLGNFQTGVTSAQALSALHRGDWTQAAACADEVLTHPDLSPQHRILPLLTIALIQARRRQQDVAALLDKSAAGAGPDDVFLMSLVRAARAEAAWLAGDDDTARTEAEEGLAATPATRINPWLVGHLRRWVHLAGGPTETTSDDPVTPYELEISGDWQAAVDAWRARGCLYDTALAQLGGDVDAVQAALATFRQLGAKAAARRARQRLTALRGPTRGSRHAKVPADPHGLTGREREVLELLTAGRTNAEIAATLYISRKTVGHHVSAIITKLGVENRTHAAAQALQRPPTTEA
jgi:DNA-binding CsgD family transcriptional regulator/tetratricopeptide (TPR) repeat protein